MTSHQESRLSTLRVILDLFYDNKDIWKGNKLIEAAVAMLEKFIAEIDKQYKLQLTPISGFSKDKEKARKKVDSTTDILCKMYCAYGSNIGSETIYQQFNLSPSKISTIQDNKMPTTIGIVKQFGNENIDILKDFGPIEELLAKYGKEEQGYINYLSKPTEGKAIRAAATKELVKVFSGTSAYLKRDLDKLMGQFEITNKDFYNQYKESRNIYDNPSHRTALLGTVANQDTNNPEPDVKVTATSTDQPEVIVLVKMSGETGYYGFQKMAPGIWTITFEKLNFDTITQEVEIIAGKSKRLDVKIRPTE